MKHLFLKLQHSVGSTKRRWNKVLRGNESASLSQKVALITKWIKDSKKKEENKEEIKEESKVEDLKVNEIDSEDDDPEENDPLTIYGIETNEKLESKVNEL